MDNRFERNELYFGEEVCKKLSLVKVCVVGVGGVGSYAVESLARLGVSNFVLIDKDKVDITNINRQIIALQSTLNKEKTSVLKERVLDINPSAKVKEYSMFLNKETINIVIEEKPDFVVDAIDTISCKWELIKLCLDNNIDFISSTGMGNRMDLTKLVITTLDKTNYDPVSKKLRELVRKDNRLKDMKKINVVFSNELPKKQQTIVNVNGKTMKETCPPASIMFVPSAAGMLCAYYIVKKCL